MNVEKSNKVESEKQQAKEPTLTKKEVAKWAGHWLRLEVTVHHFKEYFPLDIYPILDRVVNFYAQYGVIVRWQEAEADSSLLTHLAQVKEMTETGLPLCANPDLEFFWKHVPHQPTIFFVGDIRVKGYGGLRSWFGPDVEGFTFLNTFVFVAYSNAPWIPRYEVTVARELGHVLGLANETTGTSLMSKGYHSSLDADLFLPGESATLRQSPWLRRARNVKPSADAKHDPKRNGRPNL